MALSAFPFKKISIGLIVILLLSFLWINADWIWLTGADAARNELTIYFIFFLLILTAYNVGIPGMKEPAHKGGFGFAIGFIATALFLVLIPLLVILQQFLFSATVTGTIIFAGALMIAFGKAWIEEVIFRDVLPLKAGLGDIVSNILFGVFHFSIIVLRLGLVIEAFYAMAFLMVLGLIWAKVFRDRFGLLAATGSHMAYNLWVLGTLPAAIFGI